MSYLETYNPLKCSEMLWYNCLDAHLAVVAVFPSLPPWGPHSPGQLRFHFPATSASTFLTRPSQPGLSEATFFSPIQQWALILGSSEATVLDSCLIVAGLGLRDHP